jgi:hypothetical protein
VKSILQENIDYKIENEIDPPEKRVMLRIESEIYSTENQDESKN